MQESEIIELITKMKSELLDEVAEWLGSDIPEENTEDYDDWQSRLMEIEDIRSFGDVKDYLENRGRDAGEFFEEWEVQFNEQSGNFELTSSPRIVEDDSIISQLNSDEIKRLAKGLVEWYGNKDT